MPRGLPLNSGAYSPSTPNGRRGGRRKGVPNKVKQEVRELATRMVTDPIYLKNLMSRLRFGECAPGVEITLLHYAFGAPPKTLIVEGLRAPLMFLTMNQIGVHDPMAEARPVARPAIEVQAERVEPQSVVQDGTPGIQPEPVKPDLDMDDLTEIPDTGNGFYR